MTNNTEKLVKSWCTEGNVSLYPGREGRKATINSVIRRKCSEFEIDRFAHRAPTQRASCCRKPAFVLTFVPTPFYLAGAAA
jgi:hypothetical protein